MEEAKTIPHWLYQVLGALAAFLGGGGVYKLITIYLNRHKPKAEVHETEARATEITIRSHSTAGDAVIRMIDRLEETQERIDVIREERDELAKRVDLMEIEARLARGQIKRLKALLDLHEIKYSEFDEEK